MRFADWLFVILIIGTVGRITRLLNGDTLTEPFRVWLRDRAVWSIRRGVTHPLGGSPIDYFRRFYRTFWQWLNKLVACPWCVSVWVSVAVTYTVIWFPTNRFILGGLIACTASYVVGNVQMREPDPHDDE